MERLRIKKQPSSEENRQEIISDFLDRLKAVFKGKRRPVRHSGSSSASASETGGIPPWEKVQLWEMLLILLVFVILAGLNYDWIVADMAPPFEHSGRSIQDSVVLWGRLCDGRGFGPASYPPAAYLVSVLFYRIFGVSRVVALASQIVWLIPYLASGWYLGRVIGGRWGGIITLIACAGNPWMSIHLHGYFLEVALTAMVGCTFALVLISRNCTRPWLSVLLGLCMGIGMLAKWSFIFFIIPALVLPFIQAWKEGGRSRWLGLAFLVPLLATVYSLKVALSATFWGFPRNAYLVSADAWLILAVAVYLTVRKHKWNAGAGLCTSLCVAFFSCSWWYFLSIQELQLKAQGDFGQGFSLGQCMLMLAGTVVTCCWLSPLWFGGGLAYGLLRKHARALTLASCAGIVIALLFYTFSRVPPGPRYMLPATLLFLTVAFAWTGRLPYARWGVLALVTFLSFVQLAFYMLPSGPWDGWVKNLRAENLKVNALQHVPAPNTQRIPIKETAQRILEELNISGEYRITGIILPKSRVDADMIMLESILQGRLIDIEHFLPGRTQRDPRTSLVLIIGDDNTDFLKEFPDLANHKLLETWSAPGWGKWALYQHPTRHDDRPLPGVTDGPPVPTDIIPEDE